MRRHRICGFSGVQTAAQRILPQDGSKPPPPETYTAPPGPDDEGGSPNVSLDVLPDEMLAAIFLLLPLDARARATTVCHRWRCASVH